MSTNYPEGMKSNLPIMAKEIYQIKDDIANVFNKWNYRQIMTPLLEYYDILKKGVGEKNRQELYKLIDREGNVLAMRSEMTAPIARTVANREDEISLPARFSYFAPVYRYSQDQQGKKREIYQMGIECVGSGKIESDVEAVIMAVEAIKATGIENFEIDIGHIEYLERVFSEFDLSEKEKEKIKSFMNKRNFVGLHKYLSGFSNSQLLGELLLLRGGEEIFEKIYDLTDNNLILHAVKDLKEVYNFLTDYGVARYINFDLSLIRGFNYYTGIVFEGFSKSLGYLICGGGRYDNLIEKFSEKKIPAVGFALGIERIRLALKSEGKKFDLDNNRQLILFESGRRNDALSYVRDLHQEGIKASFQHISKDEIVSCDQDKNIILKENIEKKFKKKGIKRLVIFINDHQGSPEMKELE